MRAIRPREHLFPITVSHAIGIVVEGRVVYILVGGVTFLCVNVAVNFIRTEAIRSLTLKIEVIIGSIIEIKVSILTSLIDGDDSVILYVQNTLS